MIIMQLRDYRKASQLYEDTAKRYASSEPSDTADEKSWDELIDVDLTNLRKENKDIVGWIYFENEEISYPVLYSGDDQTYLRKAYTGEKVRAGSIFVEGKNNSDFSDAHTIIYGHNMRNLSMFGKLKYYLSDSEYYTGHEYFQIITEEKKYRYKIFSYKKVTPGSDEYMVFQNGGQNFAEFVANVLRNESDFDTGEIVTATDHIITLSTCSGDDRLIVSAIRCDECDITK